MVSFRAGRSKWPPLVPISKRCASHARWAAKSDGGVIAVYDAAGNLFKTIEVAPDVSGEDGFVLPSV
jgi:hypothetical protein